MIPTNQAKRIAVAEEVLSLLKDLKFKIKEGDYCIIEFKKEIPQGNNNLQKLLPDIESCKICALGGMFLAHVKLWNKFSFNTDEFGLAPYFSRDDFDYKTLLKVFSEKQLSLIDSAFEEANMGDFEFVTDKEVEELYSAIKFGSKYKNPKRRLTAIMNNILTNKGTFIP